MIAPWLSFTAEQQRAALLVDRPMLAAAGAGAGKTAVMAVRYCACLLDRDRDADSGGGYLGPERVLAVAFTREAAGNLRARIDRTLRVAIDAGRFPRLRDGALEETDLDPAEVAHLRACLDALAAAPITTFDGWCLQVVGEHAAELGRDPDLAPPDELVWERCREQAWQELRRDELAAGRDELPRLCEAYGEGAVRAAVASLGDRASAMPRPSLRADERDPLDALFALRAPQLAALRAAVADAKRFAGGDTVVARKLRAVAVEPPSALDDLRAWLLELDEVTAVGRDAEQKEAIRRIQDALDFPNQRDAEGKRPAKDKRRGRGSLLSLIPWDPAAEERLRERAAAVAVLADRLLILATSAAERAGVAGFARVEAEMLALLESRAVRERLGRRYRHVLLDEAQDLNRLQGRIVELLQDGGADARSATVFTVGDHRQSIFGFRHADPAIFGGWERSIAERGGASAALAENFRSHPELLAEIAGVFAQPALAAAFRPDEVRAGRDADDRPTVLACWSAAAHDAQGPIDVRRGGAVSTDAQARLVAQVIAQSLEAGRAPGEHAILLRARSRMRVYAAALEAAGVPYDTDFPGGLYDSQECHDIEAILRLALCPHDRFALAVAYGGPWGVADAHDRAAMAEALALAPGDAWRRAASDTVLHEVVAKVRALLAAEGPAAAIRALAVDSRLARRYGALPLARRRLANLVALAAEAEAGGEALDAASVVARLAERRRLGVDAAEASGDEVGGRGVRLMTIHGAKGLEWPVVLLPELDRRFEARDLRSFALAQARDGVLEIACRPDSDDGIGLRAALMQDALQRHALAEEARLFYVACTRATHELHCLVGADPPTGPAADGSAACPGDWLTGAGCAWSTEPVRVDLDAVRVVPDAADTAPLPPLAVSASAEAPVAAVTREIDEPVSAAGDGALGSMLNRDLGIALHAALARFGPGMSASQAGSAVAAFRGQVDDARLDRLAARLADRELVPGYWGASVRLGEQPVVTAQGDGVLLGICDLLLRSDDGRWRLYDYKSGATAGRQGAEQVRLYARMLAPHLDGPLIEGWLIDLEHGRHEAVDLSA